MGGFQATKDPGREVVMDLPISMSLARCTPTLFGNWNGCSSSRGPPVTQGPAADRSQGLKVLPKDSQGVSWMGGGGDRGRSADSRSGGRNGRERDS